MKILLILCIMHAVCLAAPAPPTSTFRIIAQSGSVTISEAKMWRRQFELFGCRYILEHRFDEYTNVACVEVLTAEKR